MAFRNINVVLTANVSQYTAAMGKASAATAGFQKTAQSAGQGAANFGRQSNQAAKGMHNMQRGAGVARAQVDRLAGAFKYGQKAGAAMSGQMGLMAKGFAAVKSFAASAVLTLGGFLAIHAVINLTRQVVMGAVDAFMTFDAALTESMAIMSEADRGFREQIIQSSIDISKTTVFTAAQVAEGYYFLASAGMSATQSMAAMGSVAKFAQAGMMDLAEATELVLDAQTAIGLKSTNVETNAANLQRVMDVLVRGAIDSNATVQQLAESLANRAGAAARLVGKDVEETTAVLEAFATVGVKGAEAGTRLDIVWRDLQRRAIQNTDAMNQFGVKVFDANGEMRNTADIVQDMEVAFAGMSDEQKRSAIMMMGFQDRSVAAILSLMGLSDEMRNFEAANRKAAGSVEDIANRQMESLSNKIKALTHNFQAWAIRGGRAVVTVAGALASKLAPAAESVSKIMADLVHGATTLAVGFAKIAAVPLVPAFKGIVSGGSGILGFFARNEQVTRALVTIYLSKYIPAMVAVAASTYANVRAQFSLGISLEQLRARHAIYGLALATNTTQMSRLAFMTEGSSGAFTRFAARVVMATAALKARSLSGFIDALRDMEGQAKATGMSLSTALTGGLTAVMVLVPLAMSAFTHATQKAKEAGDAWREANIIDVEDGNWEQMIDARNTALDDYNRKMAISNAAIEATDTPAIDNALQAFNPFDENTIADTSAATQDALDAFNELDEPVQNMMRNVDQLQERTGLSFREVVGQAEHMGIDLSQAYNISDDARAAFIAGVEQQERITRYASQQAGIDAGMMSDAWAMQYSDMEAVTEDVRKGFESWADPMTAFQDAVDNSIAAMESFRSASEVFSSTQSFLDNAAKESADAQAEAWNDSIERQMDAQEELTDAERQAYEDRKKTSEDFFVAQTVTADQYIAALEDQARQQAEFEIQLATIRSKGGSEAAIANLRDLGAEGLSITAELASGTEENIARFDAALNGMGEGVDPVLPTLEEQQAALEGQMEAYTQWTDDLMVINDNATSEQAQAIAAMGMDFAPQARQWADAFRQGGASADMAQAVIDDMSTIGSLAQDPIVEGFMNATQLAAAAAGDGAKEAVTAIITQLNLLPGQVDDLREQFGLAPLPRTWREEIQGQRRGMDLPRGRPRNGGNGRIGSPRNQAEGGLVTFGGGGMINRYMNGGDPAHVAQVAKAGDWRVWAEPETGGEAYIPMGANKRERSTAILEQVAGQFGYALMPMGGRVGSYRNGGVTDRSPGDAMLGGARGYQAAPEPIIVEVPVSKVSPTYFTGPIQGAKMEDVQKFADRKKRQAALQGT